MELCHNCPVPASCAIRGKCITDLAPVPDPRLSITADEFVAMARDAERYRFVRTIGDLDADALDALDLPDPKSAEDFDRIIDAAMAERNK